jgi:predicted SpoU family rRNA methylase
VSFVRKSIVLLLMIALLIIIGQIITGSTSLDMSKAEIVEDNIHRTGGTFKITDSFDAYFLMRDYDKSPLPLLVHIKFDYMENKENDISDNINNFSIEVHGMKSKIVRSMNEDSKYYYSFRNAIKNVGDKNEVVESKNREAEIAYLKKKFSDKVEIVSNNKNIIYKVNEEIDEYWLSLDFIRDPQKDELNLTVRDNNKTSRREGVIIN